MVFTDSGLKRLNSIINDCSFIRVVAVTGGGVRVKTEDGDLFVSWDGSVERVSDSPLGSYPAML